MFFTFKLLSFFFYIIATLITIKSQENNENEENALSIMVEKYMPTVSQTRDELLDATEAEKRLRVRLLLERMLILYDRIDKNAKFLTDLLRMKDASEGFYPTVEINETIEEFSNVRSMLKMIQLSNDTMPNESDYPKLIDKDQDHNDARQKLQKHDE